ncbi:MAG: thioredoxin family protein [Elusimicrobia bacterium]|nr:thioredoxin family protein [Elusimicrobiota bacterium]
MAFLEADIREKLRERLLDLAGPVRLVFFKENMSDACERAEGLLKEVVALTDKIELKVYNRYLDDTIAAEYGIEASPTLILEGPAGGRVRLMGKLVGYEFAVFLAALKDTAAGKAEVGQKAREKLGWVAQPARIRCFITPACVHCPKVARTAQRFAVEYSHVTAEIIDITEFPALAAQYEVDQVPKVIINDRVMFLGAAPEHIFAQAVALSVQGERQPKVEILPRAEGVRPPNPQGPRRI